MERGSAKILLNAADAAEVSVVTRKTCTSWKTKYACWVKSSTIG